MASWKLFNVSGIDIKLHWSTLLFLGLFFLFDWFFFLVVIVLFVSVTLHELSHSLVAKHNGIRIDQIILLPIGGMASLRETDLKPLTEFKMSVAGPLFNFFLCAVIALSVYFLGPKELLLPLMGWNAAFYQETISVGLLSLFLSSVFWLNFILGAFNFFFPAFPLDGGRVLRSLLAMKLDYVKATKAATIISNVLTALLFLVALLSWNLILLVIAVFIFFGARSEMEQVVSKRLLKGFPLRRVMRNNFLLVDPDTPLDEVIMDMINSRSLVAFSRAGNKVKSLNIYEINQVPRDKWKTTFFDQVSKPQKPINSSKSASQALKRMQVHGLEALPVMQEDQIIGCVFKEDLDTVIQLLKVSKG